MSVVELSDSASSSCSSLNITGETMVRSGTNKVAVILHWSCSLLLVSLSVYLVVLAFTGGFTLFSLHPIGMAIAFLVLFPQAITFFEQDYYKNINHKQRVQYHKYVQIAGIICTAIGFIAIYVNKNLHSKHHFKSYHGIAGLIVVILVCLVGLGGALADYSFSLRNYVKPVYIKIVHSFAGILLIIVANLTVILGLYTHWFAKFGNVNLIWPIIVVISINSLLVLRKAVATIKDRVMSTLERSTL